jgi:hypothetical protein
MNQESHQKTTEVLGRASSEPYPLARARRTKVTRYARMKVIDSDYIVGENQTIDGTGETGFTKVH